MEQEALFTVQEAAAWIGVTEATIRHATIDGQLPFVRKRGRNLIESSQLRAYCARTHVSEEEQKATAGSQEDPQAY